MPRTLVPIALLALAAATAHAGDIAIYKGTVATISLKPKDGKLKQSAERGTGYFITTLPGALKDSKGVILVPGKDGKVKVLRQSRTFDLTAQIVAMTDPSVQGSYVLAGAVDYGTGHTGLSARGQLKAGLKEQVNASQDLPKNLKITERYFRVANDSGRGHFERHAGVKLDVKLTKASNDAAENLDAAIARVKALFPKHVPGAGF